MSSDLRKQIYANLNSKDTEELLDIWKTNDRVEWSDLAFEVLEEILSQRVDDLPEQGKPILEKSEEEPADDLEDWEAKILDSENQPELYDTLEVISTVDNINKVAKASIFVYAFVGLVSSYGFQGIILGAVSFTNIEELLPALWSIFISILNISLQIAIVYFPLKALTYILRILMEMEFNSRKQ